MEYINEAERKTKVLTEVDVVVAGAGPSGIVAAIAAARNGAKTVLIEQDFCIGSNITLGPLEAIMTFHDSSSQIVNGIPQEIIDQMKAEGGTSGHVKDTVGYCSTITPFDPEVFKTAVLEMLKKANVQMFLQTMLVGVIKEKSNIKGILIENKSGRQAILARQFIDCTGDGDLCVLAGEKFEMGRAQDGMTQPMTLLFKMGGVDVPLLKDYIRQNMTQFKFDKNLESPLDFKILHLWGFGDVLAKGFKTGRISLKRCEMHMITTGRENEVIINFSRVDGDGTNADDVTNAYIKSMAQIKELSDYLKDSLPAFKDAYILFTGKVGKRETRRIAGKYVLKGNEILNQTEFFDTVAKGAFPIDIHQPGGGGMYFELVTKAYNIPLRCLLAEHFENLLMAGRCISIDYKALASIRISASCMATGQAAGVTAALASVSNRNLLQVPIQEILDCIRKWEAVK
jgi:hypothetical protein